MSVTSWKGSPTCFHHDPARYQRTTVRGGATRPGFTYHNQVVLNSAGEGIYGVDRSGVLLSSTGGGEMFGVEAGDLIGRSMDSYVFLKIPVRVRWGVTLSDSGNGYGREIRAGGRLVWRKDGTSFPVEYVSTPMWERREIVGAVVVFKDTTDRKRAEAQLQDSCGGCGNSQDGWRASVKKRGRIAREVA